MVSLEVGLQLSYICIRNKSGIVLREEGYMRLTCGRLRWLVRMTKDTNSHFVVSRVETSMYE